MSLPSVTGQPVNHERTPQTTAVPSSRRTVADLARILTLGFLSLVVLLGYGAIGWTLRRGFDWTDESFVDAMIASNREAFGEPWGFQHVLHPLYVMTGQSVLGFRILRLLGYLLLSVALVWSARFVARRIGLSISRSGWLFILLIGQVGTFIAWSYPPRYLGYNELAAWLAQGGVALILVSLAWGLASPSRHEDPLPAGREDAPDRADAPAREDMSAGEDTSAGEDSPGGEDAPDGEADSTAAPAATWLLWPLWAGLGAITMLLVFDKVTSGMAFGAVLVLAILIPNPFHRLWKRVLAAVGGGAAVLLVLWASGSPVGFYLTNMQTLLFDRTARDGVGRSVPVMISTYQKSLHLTGRVLFPAVLIFALLVLTFRLRARPNGGGGVGGASVGSVGRAGRGGRAGRWAADLAAWLLLVLLVLRLTSFSRVVTWNYLGELVGFIGLAGVIALAILGADLAVFRRLTVRRFASVLVGGMAILAAPFISAVGTANLIAGQLLFAATLWAVVLGVALVLLAQRGTLLGSSTRAVPVLIGCLVVLLAASAVRDAIANPYRTAPLLSQNTSVSAPELRGLLLTQGLA
jgi:hypothetical protein